MTAQRKTCQILRAFLIFDSKEVVTKMHHKLWDIFALTDAAKRNHNGRKNMWDRYFSFNEWKHSSLVILIKKNVEEEGVRCAFPFFLASTEFPLAQSVRKLNFPAFNIRSAVRAHHVDRVRNYTLTCTTYHQCTQSQSRIVCYGARTRWGCLFVL